MVEITLTFENETHKGTGETILEALKSIQRPDKITTKGTILVVDGENRFERVLTVPQAKRLFYPLAQAFLSKGLALGLKY